MRRPIFLSPRSLAGLLLAAVLLAAGCASAKPEGDKLPPDLALVPRDATGFLAVRVAEVAGALDKLAKDDPTLRRMLKGLEGKGLAPAGIDRAVLIFQRDLAVVVTFSKPFDKAKLTENLVPKAKEKKAGGKTYLADADKDAALFLVNDRSILLGSPRALEGLLERLDGGKDSGALDKALA